MVHWFRTCPDNSESGSELRYAVQRTPYTTRSRLHLDPQHPRCLKLTEPVRYRGWLPPKACSLSEVLCRPRQAVHTTGIVGGSPAFGDIPAHNGEEIMGVSDGAQFFHWLDETSADTLSGNTPSYHPSTFTHTHTHTCVSRLFYKERFEFSTYLTVYESTCMSRKSHSTSWWR